MQKSTRTFFIDAVSGKKRRQIAAKRQDKFKTEVSVFIGDSYKNDYFVKTRCDSFVAVVK